jgi:hypothetical protein
MCVDFGVHDVNYSVVFAMICRGFQQLLCSLKLPPSLLPHGTFGTAPRPPCLHCARAQLASPDAASAFAAEHAR